VSSRRGELARDASLRPASFGALIAVAVRELSWTMPRVAREIRAWRTRACAIPDGRLREDALISLRRERLNVEGAALFASIPESQAPNLLRALVAYQVILDFLDTVTERFVDCPRESGLQLHRALVDALDLHAPMADYYRFHPRGVDDGGYLKELVTVCRSNCANLPGYALVRDRAMSAAGRLVVQVANHDPLPARRKAALVAWAENQPASDFDVSWFELAAAASSTLGIHALLALAVEPNPRADVVATVDAAYFPWICAASTFLDSLVDQDDDVRDGSHSYLAHYPDTQTALRRLHEITQRSVSETNRLPRAERHAVIVCGMIAMYLSKASARSSELRSATREILSAAGSLPRIQLPIMRIMRAVQGLGDA
jgi:tetraprenyl-beta-curcumene synthase